jgi:hypothetical protein
MELISWGYVQAIAACNGIQLTRTFLDDDSVDGTFISNEGTCPRIDFQLKATYSHTFRGNVLGFPLKKKNFVELKKAPVCSPRILIVLVMPELEPDWVSHGHEAFLMRNCAYWKSLVGEPETANAASVTIELDRGNFLSPESLKALMTKAGNAATGGAL